MATTKRARDLFQANVAADPDRVALVFNDTAYTYAALGRRANKFANLLRAMGAGHGDTVGVVLRRCPDLLAALLGTWQVGAAYVPLDPDIPAERIGYALTTADTSVVVTESEFADTLAVVFDGPRIVVDADAAALDAQPDTAIPCDTDPNDLAYIMFTSGSTGRPKGVAIPQHALTNLLFSFRASLSAGPDDVWLASTSVGFDISGLEFHLPLITGGRLVLAADQQRDGVSLVELVRRHGVTHVQATPSGWKLLLAAGFDFPGVVALTGGEALPAEVAARLRPAVRDLVNVYGPTETTIWSTQYEIAPAAAPIRIGRALANTRLHVLDGDLRRVPIGVIGQLYIGGDGLARGYVNRPDLTAAAFVPEPFAPKHQPGSRMYATGDLVRAHADGTLEYLGRADHQVKVNGHRIELGEIETYLLRHPAVADTVVVAREDGSGDKRLVAYVVPAADGRPEPQALREYLRDVLPAYMVPVAYVHLDRLPLNSAGKVDRPALPAPDREALPAKRRYTAPRTDTERRLARLWAEVIGVARVGRDDRFFELAGDSMAVVRFLAAARRDGLTLSLATLYQYDTLAELAGLLAGGPASTFDTPSAVMAEHGVPAVSIAVLGDGKVVDLQTHGTLAVGSTVQVTPDTLFQTGSISKHVVALGALHLVSTGRIDLDTDVNKYLTSWRVPDPGGITLRHLLANLSGLSVTASTAYHPDETRPRVVDILSDVFVELTPGQVFRKHNTHSAVIERLLCDVTGQEFPELMHELVLGPLGMTSSSYAPEHPLTSGLPVALGHDEHGVTLDGGWRERAVRAAGGLWTTAIDLAAVAIEIRAAYLGEPGRLMTQVIAEEMLSVAFPGTLFGLGTSVDPTGPSVEFGHIGEAPGYRAASLARIDGGAGLIVLTNSDNGREVHKFVATTAGPRLGGLGQGMATAHAY